MDQGWVIVPGLLMLLQEWKHIKMDIYLILVKFAHTPVGDSTEGLGLFLTLLMRMKDGPDYNFSEMKIYVQCGTHGDALGHTYDNYYDEGYGVDSLFLRVLNGNNDISTMSSSFFSLENFPIEFVYVDCI